MRPFDLLTPETMDEALALLSDPGGRPIAGGTDLVPIMQAGKLHPERVIDLSRLPDLCGICQDGDDLVRIGALTTHAQLEASALLWERAAALAESARSVGGVQTRQRGTVGGNLVHASPAADVALALLALEAQVTLRSLRGGRKLSLEEFLTGPGQTIRRDDELLAEVTSHGKNLRSQSSRVSDRREELHPLGNPQPCFAPACEVGRVIAGADAKLV